MAEKDKERTAKTSEEEGEVTANATVYDKYKEKINPFLSENDKDWFVGYTEDGHAIENGSCK